MRHARASSGFRVGGFETTLEEASTGLASPALKWLITGEAEAEEQRGRYIGMKRFPEDARL